MPERELIEHIRDLARSCEPPWLSVGMGDDAAEIEVPGAGRLVVTTDSVIAGVHFESGTPPDAVGHKAIARAHSDTAAMAARPLCSLAAVCFPLRSEESDCRALCDALFEAARQLGAPLVGGDISSTPGPLTVVVTAMGTPGPAGVVTRDGARNGDAVCVTGELGGAILGRHLTFTPRIEEALTLAERFDMHAMIDISDGLSTDLLHLAEMSHVSVDLYADSVPVSAAARTLASRTGRSPLWHALNDGEDYELLFCLPRSQASGLTRAGVDDMAVAVIGEVTESGDSQIVMPDGTRQRLLAEGWEHLSK